MRGRPGATGPTRATYDWSAQSSPAATSNRWIRRGQTAYLSVICGHIVIGATRALTSISVKIYGTALATDSCTFTLQKNGSDTALTCTIAAGATTASGSGSVSIAPGDYITMKLNQSGTEAQSQWWVYVAVTD